MPDKSKQEVLLDFVQNKAVLRAIYDMMFSDKDVRAVSPLEKNASGIDFNRLIMQHQKDQTLLSKLPSLAESARNKRLGSNGAKSATNLRSLRRRNSNSIEAAARYSAAREKEGN